jgi:hypothetical protein
MRDKKKIQKYFEGHTETLGKVFDGIDQYTSIKKEDTPSLDHIGGNLIEEYLGKKHDEELTLNSQRRSPFILRKAFLIPVVICIVIGIFFATAPGQAFCESIFHTVTQWFDSSVNIHHGDEDSPIEAVEPDTTYYDTIEDVRTAISEKIVYNIENSITQDVLVQNNGSELRVVSTYSTASNSEITVTQTIFEDNTQWDTNITSNDGKAIDITLANGTRFVGYVSDNYNYAVAYQGNIYVEIYSENSDYDTFVAFIEKIQIE